MIYTADNLDRFLWDVQEYRFIDEVEVQQDQAKGIYYVDPNSWYFKMIPTMPIGFVMESVMQTGIVLYNSQIDVPEKNMIPVELKNVKVYGKVWPGDILVSNTVFDRSRHGILDFHGLATVETNEVCDFVFRLVSQSCINRFKLVQ